jgi:NADH-quinone oxidoreductase subunit C
VYQINTDRDQLVVSKIAEHFKDATLEQQTLADMLCITVGKEIIYDLLTFLRDEETLQYNFLTTLCGMHYPEREKLGVVYHLHSFVHNHRIRFEGHPNLKRILNVDEMTDFPMRKEFPLEDQTREDKDDSMFGR